MATNKIAIRRDTAANWTSADPTLVSGEFALETDSHKLKNGDGATAYTSLGYLRPINAVTVTGNHTVASNEDVVNVNAASATITLPAADVIGRRVTVRKVSASAGTVSTQRAGTDTIDGGTAAKALKAQFGSATFEVVASGSWSMVHRYEEGTWTPSLAGSTTPGTAAYGGGRHAHYTLTGSAVVVSFFINGTWTVAPTGNLNIAGLPYDAGIFTTYGYPSVKGGFGYSLDSVFMFVNGSYIDFQKTGGSIASDASAAALGTDISDAAFNLYSSIAYATDE